MRRGDVRTLGPVLVLGLALLLCGGPAVAQVTTATISGTVTETSQAVVPGATVTVTNVDTGISRTAVTDRSGRYRIPQLSIGPYRVEAELPGFKREVRTGITLTVGREAIVDFVLEIGQITEEVVVLAEVPLVNTTSGELAGLVDQKTISDLPLSGRDLMQLMTLETGVSFVRHRNKGVSQGGQGNRATIHGTRETMNLFLLDGTELNDTLGRSPGGEAGVFMGAEAVQEFKVLLHNFSAEYGRAAGGVFNAVTKSGTNDFRGSAFEFHRNSRFDAKDFFDEEKLPFRRHQFGFSLGGPIVRNRAFFFATYEGLRDRLTETRLHVVPSAEGRQGILGSTHVTVNPAVQPYLGLYPLPNGRDFGDGTGELFAVHETATNQDYVTGRVDYTLGQSDSFFARYTYDNSTRTGARQSLPEWLEQAQSHRIFVTAEHTRILTPNLVNVARVGFGRPRTSDGPTPTNPHADLEFVPGRNIMGRLEVTGLEAIGAQQQHFRTFTLRTWQGSNSLLRSSGSHQTKVGVDLTHYSFNQIDSGAINGQWEFTSLANLLQGVPRQFRVGGITPQEADDRTFVQWLVGAYAQHDYQVRSNLTLNLGLRYETASVPEEVEGRWAGVASLTDPTTTIGLPMWENPTRKNFAPRVGFAWDPGGGGTTAVRGGFGVFYDPPLTSHWRNRFNNTPFRRDVTIRTPVPVFPNTLEVQRDVYLMDTSPSNAFIVEDNPKPSYIMQYNLMVERQLGANTVVSIGYSGHRGKNLMAENDHNIATPIILPDGRKFFPEGAEPLNPNFARMRVNTYNGESWYDALLLQANRRLAQGLAFKVSYTFSKTMDHSSLMNRGDGGGNFARTWQDPHDRDAEKGLSDLHVAHNLVISGSYELPFGRGTRLGGWQVSAIFTGVSGIPFTPIVGFDINRNGSTDLIARPDRVAGVPLILGGVDRYFDPEAFVLQEPGFYGNAGRNIMIGPPLRTLDLALMKNTALKGNARLQIRLELFNALNRPNFGAPLATVFDSRGRVASAGRITETVTPARQMQLGARFTF